MNAEKHRLKDSTRRQFCRRVVLSLIAIPAAAIPLSPSLPSEIVVFDPDPLAAELKMQRLSDYYQMISRGYITAATPNPSRGLFHFLSAPSASSAVKP